MRRVAGAAGLGRGDGGLGDGGVARGAGRARDRGLLSRAPTLSPLHRLWRRLPAGARRRALLGGAGLLAPRPDRVAPPPQLGVAVAGEPDGASGLGEGARLMLLGLSALGVRHWEGGGVPAGVPLVLHLNPAAVPLGMLRLGRGAVRGRRIVGVWPWELQEVPRAWRAAFGYVHEVWAPSRFSAAAVAAAAPAGFPPVLVVPHPVWCDLGAAGGDAGAAARAELGVERGAVLTVVVFNLASSFARKNPLGAIAAHRAAFGARADRVLLMRVGNVHAAPADFAQLRAAARDLPNVRFDTRTRTRAGARAVMAAADIVLSLHRSEGFGLVPAEAMAMGKPVVATGWSGTEDFLDDRWAVRVPARLVPAVDPRGVFSAPGAMWAEPDVEAAAEALRRLAGDAGLRAGLGAAARAAAAGRLGTDGLAAAVRGLGLGVAGLGGGLECGDG